MAPRLIVRIAYLGGRFEGWQRQPGRRTVQGELEAALAALYRAQVSVTGAGRTDAGVHAAGQVAHFDPPRDIPPAGLTRALEGLLPDDLQVLSCRLAPQGFHARRSAVTKLYRYRLAWGPPLTPWEAARTWRLRRVPDLAAMRRALLPVAGTHDFAAFALSGHSGTGRRGTERSVLEARLASRGRRASILVEGDGFLRGMVRRITGAAVEVGLGRQEPEWIETLLGAPATRPPAPTAPALGLTLERVRYRPQPALARGVDSAVVDFVGS